jgi:uncharacterized protein YchJ
MLGGVRDVIGRQGLSVHAQPLQQAPTAMAVLRARFSAYAKKEWKYVVRNGRA